MPPKLKWSEEEERVQVHLVEVAKVPGTNVSLSWHPQVFFLQVPVDGHHHPQHGSLHRGLAYAIHAATDPLKGVSTQQSKGRANLKSYQVF